MSKKKKKKTSRPVRKPAPKPSVPKINLLERPSTETAQDPLLRRLFWGVLGLAALVMMVLAPGTGINGDDEYQVDYSEKLVAYYASAGADTSALYIEKGNMHNYGGFFDLTTGLVNEALGYDEFDAAYHNIRHWFNALFGILTMLFVGLLAREIAGWRAGILAVAFLFLSPRFLGHSLMNPKDIPFAAGFAVAYYYLVLLLRAMPKPDWRHALGLALGIALALATRAGGLLLVAYMGLFAGLDFLFRYGWKGLTQEVNKLTIYAAYILGVVAAGYVLGILTWPAALVDPIGHPLEALSAFSELGVRIRLLFTGENIMSDVTDWYYPVLWIAITVPLFVLIGFIASFFFLPQLLRRYAPLPVLLAYFATLFPVVYIIAKDSLLHDGWRHLNFVYPSLVVVAVLFWVRAEELFRKNNIVRYVLYGVLGLTMLESTVFILRNPHVSYVYFNPLPGGLQGAFGNYETDYWGVSTKQALDWMASEGILDPDRKDTLIIGTTFFYPVSRQLGELYNENVKVRYVRFSSRYNEEWDYGIFPSRFIRGAHLRANTWPNSKTVHTVSANGVPLTAVEKDEGNFAAAGEAAIKRRAFGEAAQAFRRELEQHPDNELAWLGLANASLNQGSPREAVQAAEEALRIAPENENALYLLGLAYLRAGDGASALNAFERAVAANEGFSLAYYYLGLIYQQRQNWTLALNNAMEAIRLNPRFKAAYELVASIYESQGDSQTAARYREAAGKL